MKPNTPDMHRRNIGIDILRGLSILSVILLHFNIRVPFKETMIGEALPKMWYSFIFWNGYYGVCIFFVISGFLIATSALNKWGSLPEINTKAFYGMRFARIIPLLSLLLIVLSFLHLQGASGFVINEERTSLGRAVLAALGFHINWLEIKVGYLPGNWDVLWSLSIEETFYLFFPLLCLLVKTERQFIAIVAIFLLISPYARTSLYPGNELGDKNHLAYLDAIAMGCVAAILSKRDWLPHKAIPWLTAIGWIFVVAVVLFKRIVYQAGLSSIGLNVTLLAIGTALVLMGMQHRMKEGRQKNYLALRWLAAIGRNSYEIYLTHMFVVILLVRWFKAWGGEGEWIWGLYLGGILLSALLGEAVARGFSNPMNRYLRKRFVPNSPSTPVAQST